MSRLWTWMEPSSNANCTNNKAYSRQSVAVQVPILEREAIAWSERNEVHHPDGKRWLPQLSNTGEVYMTADMAFECVLVSRDPGVVSLMNKMLDKLAIST